MSSGVEIGYDSTLLVKHSVEEADQKGRAQSAIAKLDFRNKQLDINQWDPREQCATLDTN